MKTALSLTAALFALTALAATASAGPAVYINKDGLGLSGYDPVAYFATSQPTQGEADITHKHNGVTYRFASAENRARFQKDPAAYLPQYGGFCSWAVSRGYTAKTDPTAWKIVDGKLYLNYNRKVRSEWVKDIPGNIAKANKNWPGLAKAKANEKARGK